MQSAKLPHKNPCFQMVFRLFLCCRGRSLSISYVQLCTCEGRRRGAPERAMPDAVQSPLALAAMCRRLFLRRWRAQAGDGTSSALDVSVEIWVPLAHSTSESDDLSGVLDYNVMRDALLKAGNPASEWFADTALNELMRWPVVQARIEIVCRGTGETIQKGCREIGGRVGLDAV